jgi:uncharacterized membrane protein HdeD (DUF308 family)
VPLLGGIVGVVFGALALYYYPALSLTYVVVWTTVWLILLGCTEFYVALRERALGVQWGWTMTIGVLAIVTGGLAITNPAATLAALLALTSTFALFVGAAMLIGAGKLRSIDRHVRDVADEALRPELQQQREQREQREQRRAS